MQEFPPLPLSHGAHLLLQQDIPLQLGHGAHGAHFVGQQPESHGTWLAQPASNIAPAAIAVIKPVFIIHFPLYFELKTNPKKFFRKTLNPHIPYK